MFRWIGRLFRHHPAPSVRDHRRSPVIRVEPLDDRALPSGLVKTGWVIESAIVDSSNLGNGINAVSDVAAARDLAVGLGFAPDAPVGDWLAPVLTAAVLEYGRVDVRVDAASHGHGGALLLRSEEGTKQVPVSGAELPEVREMVKAFETGKQTMRNEYGPEWPNVVLNNLVRVIGPMLAPVGSLPAPPPPHRVEPLSANGIVAHTGYPPTTHTHREQVPVDPPTTHDAGEDHEHLTATATPVVVDTDWLFPDDNRQPRKCEAPAAVVTHGPRVPGQSGSLAWPRANEADDRTNTGPVTDEPTDLLGGFTPFDAERFGEDVARFLEDLCTELPLAGSVVSLDRWTNLVAAALAAGVLGQRSWHRRTIERLRHPRRPVNPA